MADAIATTIQLNAKDNTRAAFARLDKNLKRTANSTRRMEASMVNLKGAVLRATAVLVAFTVTAVAIGSSIGAAKAFGRQMAEVSTLIDDADTSLTAYAETVNNLIRTYGGDFKSTTKALYDTISAGSSTVAEASQILTAANVAAIAGVSDIATATDALTTVLNSYELEASEATRVSDILFKTIKLGKTTLSELAPVLGQVVPTAAAMGITFEEVGAVLATATAKGIQTSQAVTGLKAVIANIIKPTEDAKKQMASLGIQFDSAALKAKGFSTFFSEILEAAKVQGIESGVAMEKFFASVEGLNTILALTSGEGAVFAKNLMMIGAEGAATAEAFEKMTKTFDFQWGAFIGKIKVGAKNFGSIITDGLIGPLESINKNFKKWGFNIGHTFAQVLDVAQWLTNGVMNAFMPWQDIVAMVDRWFLTPLIDSFKFLYNIIVGNSIVPDLVRDVNEALTGSNGLGKTWSIIDTIFIQPFKLGFRALTHVLSLVTDSLSIFTQFALGASIPDFGGMLRGVTPEVVKLEDSFFNIAAIFAGGAGLAAMRKFLGIGLFAIAFKLFDRIIGKVGMFTGALRANRAVAFQAAEANQKLLLNQEKFLKNRATFAGNYGKQLQKIVNAGGTRNMITRFFGGSDAWSLAKAKAKDSMMFVKQQARGLIQTADGAGRQGWFSRVLYGKLSPAEISARLKAVSTTAEKIKRDLGKTGGRGFLSFANNAAGVLTLSLGKSLVALTKVGNKVKVVGTTLKNLGTKMKIAAALARVNRASGLLNSKLAMISPTAAKVANVIKSTLGTVFMRIGDSLTVAGTKLDIWGAKARIVFDKIKAKAVQVQMFFKTTALGRGIVGTALFGVKTAAGLAKLGVMTLKGVARAGGKVRSGLAGGLMAFMMFGDDIKASLGAAKLVKSTGDTFTDFKNKAKAAADAMPSTSLAMLALLGPIGMLAAGVALAFKHWDKIKEVFNDFVAWAGKQDWGEILLKGLRMAGEALKNIGGWIADMAIKGIMLLGTKLGELGAWMWDKITFGFDFGAMGEDLFASFKDISSKIIDLIMEWNPITLWLRGVTSLSTLIGKTFGLEGDESSVQFGTSTEAPGAADGGKVVGSGTSRSDSIPMMLSNKEFIVNAKSAEMFLPLLEMINDGKFAGMKDGGVLKGGSTLSSLFAGNKDVTSSKAQFTATFGKVDFNDAQQFLDTLFNIKLSKEQISGLSPLILKEIKSGMELLDQSVTATMRDMESWTVENSEMSNALAFSSNATARLQSEMNLLLEPMTKAGTSAKAMAEAIKLVTESIGSFGEGWSDTILRWQDDLLSMEARGQRAAQEFIGAIDSVVEALAEGGSVGDALKTSLRSFAKNIFKDTLKRQVSKIPGLAGAGAGANNVIQATGQLLIQATGPVVLNSKGPGVSGGDKKSGIAGFFSSIFGGGGGSSTPSRQSLGYADGGIPPTNQISLVGEKGPELFLPTTKGRIIPNNKLDKINGGSVNINQTLNITEAMDPRQFQAELVKNNRIVVGLVEESYQRRGSNRGPSGQG